jgi:hypothetical protein
MTNNITTLPAPIDTGDSRVSTVAELAAIPEEATWLQRQRARAVAMTIGLDIQLFMRNTRDHGAGGAAPSRPQGIDRLGALYARD